MASARQGPVASLTLPDRSAPPEGDAPDALAWYPAMVRVRATAAIGAAIRRVRLRSIYELLTSLLRSARATFTGMVSPAGYWSVPPPKGTASAGEVCQLVTTGLSTVMVPTGRETGLASSLPTATMMLSSSLPLSSLVVFGFTPA
ncbi:hypothetical protein SANTM175S_11011 [Streptomyces antimycoticus]